MSIRSGAPLWTALALLAAGCGDSSRGPREIRSNGGNHTVTFMSSPDPVPMNQPFDLAFAVTSKSSSSAAPSVAVDARMPAHGHGMNRVPKITRQADGSFKAEGMLFHMPGHWELYFDISHAGLTERAQVDIHLK